MASSLPSSLGTCGTSETLPGIPSAQLSRLTRPTRTARHSQVPGPANRSANVTAAVNAPLSNGRLSRGPTFSPSSTRPSTSSLTRHVSSGDLTFLGSSSSKHAPIRAPNPPRAGAAVVAAAGANLEQAPATVLLFKHDLRIHDHPGLVAAATQQGPVVPLFVFDPKVISGMQMELLGPLLAAVASLRKSLRDLGSDLAVRVGPTAEELQRLARNAKLEVAEVLAEAEVESLWQEVLNAVEDDLTRQRTQANWGSAASTSVTRWSAPLFPDAKMPDSAEYTSFATSNLPPLKPLPAPAGLPAFPSGVDAGELPTLDELFIVKKSAWIRPSLASNGNASTTSNGATSAHELDHDPWARLAHNAALEAAIGEILRDGHVSAQEALQHYLAMPDPVPGRAASQALSSPPPTLKEQLRSAVEGEEACLFSSFPALFGPALALGLLSRRAAHWAAEEGGGRRVAESVRRGIASVEWHELLAWHSQNASGPGGTPSDAEGPSLNGSASLAKTQGSSGEGSGLSDAESALQALPDAPEFFSLSDVGGIPVPLGVSIRHWRWRGHLIEYGVAGGRRYANGAPAAAADGQGSAILLVHGFGAFWQHYRDVMLPLALQGHRVWSITLPGFGRSAKPAAAYSQYFWSQCVQDFIANVIQEPVVIAGNSIGGYTVASVAADCPDLVSSVVLFNSAGRIDPSESLPEGADPAAYRHDREYADKVVREKRANGPPRFVVWAVSRMLFTYLQVSCATVLRRCYPNKPERVDGPLAREIVRAAKDPGAITVVESVFFLPRPRPLNLLLEIFGGPVLVLQGRNDPLNDAVARAASLKAAFPGAVVELLDAGHCPHDEVPDEVVKHLVQWIAAPRCATEPAQGTPISSAAARAGLAEEGPLDVLAEEALLGAFGDKRK